MTVLELLQTHPGWLIGSVAAFGLLLGSFLNVVIYRLPQMLMARWRQECRLLLADDPAQAATAAPADTFNLSFPNSHCPHCQAPIRAWQNIPLLSFVLLKGRCRHCCTPIGWRYPAVELLTAVLLAVCAWRFGFGWPLAAAMTLSAGLLAMSVIDIDHQLLPDDITLPLLWLGLIANSFGLFTDLPGALWGAVLGYLALWSVYWLFRLLTGKEGMGYGDFKLLALFGAWLGYGQLPLIILLSTLLGSIIGGVWLLASRRAGATPIPFGPFLAVAGWIALLWGPAITAWYLDLSGLTR